jgi:2'-5' RNA ligase
MPRCFIALLPDGATRDRIQVVQDRLRAWDLPARWTHPEDLHLTLRFLGDVADDEFHLLPAALDPVVSALRVPELTLAGLGISGTARGSVPAAVWAAVNDPDDVCRALHADVSESLDLTPERDFVPHLTLCRPTAGKPHEGRDWPTLLAAHGLAAWGGCCCPHLALMKSAPDGALRYQVHAVWDLHA